MKKIAYLVLLLVSSLWTAQFVSPGNGTVYTMSSLSAAAPDVVVKGSGGYQIAKNVTISNGDGLLMDENTTITVDAGIVLTVSGTYNTTASALTITGKDAASFFSGINFDATSAVTMKNTTLRYGGGIKVSTGNFLMDNCVVEGFKAGLVSSSAISFATGSPVIRNSQFLKNDLPAVASGANQTVSPLIENNYLFGNTQNNSNRPQINLGPSGTGTTKIIKNTIIGDRRLTNVGGISVSSLLGIKNDVFISENIVRDNRYGATVVGNISTGTISGNVFENNNSENVPNKGGSGISLSGSTADIMKIKVEKNQFRGNLWGITLVTNAQADLGGGSLGSVGQNMFYNNGNSGNIYALYNNTPNTISATSNCWRENELSTDAMVEDVIVHQNDISTLGRVNYTPYTCAQSLSANDAEVSKVKVYPNPNPGIFYVDTKEKGHYLITDQSGRTVSSGLLQTGRNEIRFKATPGIYVFMEKTASGIHSVKLAIE